MSIQPFVPPFTQVCDVIKQTTWHHDLTVREIPAPTRIAKDSMAIEAVVSHDGEEIGSGRLIVLHQPFWEDAWEGDYRLVTMSRAEVDHQIATDPLLGEVAWSWLTDALDQRKTTYRAAAGTTTAVLSHPFGQIAGDPEENRVELRASWTPDIEETHDIVDHLMAWQDLLCLTCGIQPVPDGVVSIAPRRAK